MARAASAFRSVSILDINLRIARPRRAFLTLTIATSAVHVAAISGFRVRPCLWALRGFDRALPR
jgi:hypothetical protein